MNEDLLAALARLRLAAEGLREDAAQRLMDEPEVSHRLRTGVASVQDDDGLLRSMWGLFQAAHPEYWNIDPEDAGPEVLAAARKWTPPDEEEPELLPVTRKLLKGVDG
jgi:hypothetical protein